MVGPGNIDQQVAAAVVDKNEGNSCGVLFIENDVTGIDPHFPVVLKGYLAEIVPSEFCHHGHPGAQFSSQHRLIGAFSAKAHVKLMAQ